MKKIINYRNTALALVLAISGFMAPSLKATEDPKAIAVELQFLGQFRNKPVFQLNFTSSSTPMDYVLNIRDEFGNSLYRETLNSNIVSKKFLLNTDEIGDDTLRFEITEKKTNKTVVYEVNQDSKYVAETWIKKVN